MLEAILRIARSLKSDLTLQDLFKQKMIITHVVTFLIYLLSVVNYYIFYLVWNGRSDNKRLTNATFFFWTLSVVLQGMA